MERPNRNKEDALVTYIALIMNTLLRSQQVERGTIQTSRIWRAIKCASAVDILLTGNGVGHKK